MKTSLISSVNQTRSSSTLETDKPIMSQFLPYASEEEKESASDSCQCELSKEKFEMLLKCYDGLKMLSEDSFSKVERNGKIKVYLQFLSKWNICKLEERYFRTLDPQRHKTFQKLEGQFPRSKNEENCELRSKIYEIRRKEGKRTNNKRPFENIETSTDKVYDPPGKLVKVTVEQSKNHFKN